MPNLEFALITFSMIFFIVDPLGNIPVFFPLTEGVSPQERTRTAKRASIATLLILLLFAFIGEWILKLFRVTISSFQIAGGILIFIIALSMLQAKRSRAKSSPEEEHGRLLRLLRQTGINMLTRLMGLLLAVIAVQFVIDGLKIVFGDFMLLR